MQSGWEGEQLTSRGEEDTRRGVERPEKESSSERRFMIAVSKKRDV